MEILSDDLLKLVNALLAGFVASWVFYGLTPHPKKTPFERVVQALIFTAFVQVLLVATQWLAALPSEFVVIGYWTAEEELFWSVALALAFGFAAAVCANRGQPHKLLSKYGLTKRTAYPSEWSNAFNAARVDKDCHATLHLKGERRLHGWILEFPERPTAGHFRIADAEWYTDDCEAIPTQNGELLITALEVEFVEFDAKAVDFQGECGSPASDEALSNEESDGDSSLTEIEAPVEPISSSSAKQRCSDFL